MDDSVESGWREVFGAGVVETGEQRFAVVGVDARVDADLRVRLRFRAARHEPEDVWLTGTASFDTVGFTAVTTDEVPVVVRLLEPTDAEWLTQFRLPDLSRAQLEVIARAYAETEAVDDGGAWGEHDEPVETLTVAVPIEGHGKGVLSYLVEPPYGEDNGETGDIGEDSTMWLLRRRAAWTEAGDLQHSDDEGLVEYPVHREMVETVLEAVDAGRVVTPSAAALAGRTALSTVVGQDPEEGIIRRRMNPDLESEVRRLLEESRALGVPSDDPDVEYATWLLSGYDGPDRMAWTVEVFGVLTRMATVMAAEADARAEWSPDGDREWEWLAWWWRDMGLVAPAIPDSVDRPLLVSGQAEVWSTTDRYPNWTVYGPFNLAESFASAVRTNTVGDLFMAGYAGHGINSWGLGIVASFDAFIVTIQVHFGGGYPSRRYREAALHLIGAWDMFVAGVEAQRRAHPEQRPDRPRWLVDYSDFRGHARVSIRDEGQPPEWELGGWTPVLDVSSSESDTAQTPLADPKAWPAERALAEGLVTSLVSFDQRRRSAPEGKDDGD